MGNNLKKFLLTLKISRLQVIRKILKEKCKKLIVKVKQQDAVIKRAAGGRKESTSSEISVSEDQHQQTAEEVEKLKKLNREIELANETLKLELTDIKTLY